MAMLEAWEEAFGMEPDAANQDDADLWNAAWSVAKMRGFERETVVTWPLKMWMDRPSFGIDPATGKEIRPTRAQINDILVALDAAMETR